MDLRIITHGSSDYLQFVALRENILRKPLGLHFTAQELDAETEYIHIAAFENNKLIGGCMLIFDGSSKVRLRQMVVSRPEQGKGIGRLLISFAESVARQRNVSSVSMHARTSAADFYEKVGYNIMGSKFMELGIPHVVMEKELS